MLDERWIRSLHVEAMREEDLHAEREPHVLFQASTIGALLDGAYDGDLSFAELAEHGDLGLGTLNGLDGEMIALDGSFFRADVDGAIHPVGRRGEDAVRGGQPASRRSIDDEIGGPLSHDGAADPARRAGAGWRRRPARCASTAASSSSAPARSRARARRTGR